MKPMSENILVLKGNNIARHDIDESLNNAVVNQWKK